MTTITGRPIRRQSISNMAIIDFGWLIVVNLSILQAAIQSTIPIMAYMDEGLCLLLMFLYFITRKRGMEYSTSSEEKKLMTVMSLFIMAGFAGNVINHVVSSFIPILVDAFTCMKFAILFFIVLRLSHNRDYLYMYLEMEIKFLCIPLMICVLLNWVSDIGMGFDMRFGIRSFRFIFPHPTALTGVTCDLLAILSINKKKNKVFIAILLITLAATLRSKAIGFVALYIGLYMFVIRTGKIKLRHIAALACVAVIVGWDQMVFYFSNEEFARAALHIKGFYIANDFFPLGTGFASFASYMANVNYSPLYYQYGLWNIYGLEKGNTSFASDTFWPIIMGQFGWLGVILFFLCLFYLYKIIRKRAIDDGSLLAGLTILAYMLISSTSESAFFHPLSISHFLILAIVLNGSSKRKEILSGKKC